MGRSSSSITAAPPRASFFSRYFARRMVFPQELPSIMRKHIYTGAMGSIYITLFSGIFFIYYGNEIGMSRFQWGLMGGISSMLLAAQLFSATLTERLGHRKMLWFVCAVAARGFRFLGVLASLLLWQAGWPHASVALIGLICLGNFFGAMSSPPWMSWLADIIPERQHGGFWGRRSAWIAFSVIMVVVPAGLLIDGVPADWKLFAAIAIFSGATLLGFADLFIHGTLPEPPMVVSERRRFLRHLVTPLRDRLFRPWLVFNACWTFGMTLGGSLATLYFVEDLGIKRNFLGGAIVLTALPLVGGMLTGRWSGRLVDQVGSKRVLLWGHVFWSVLPAFWIVAPAGTAALFVLACSSLVGGTSSTAAANAATKLITRLPSPENRAMYTAVSACLGSLAGGLGVLTAGTLLKVVGDWHTSVAGASFGAFHLLFAASLVLRFGSALLLIRRIPDPRVVTQTPP